MKESEAPRSVWPARPPLPELEDDSKEARLRRLIRQQIQYEPYLALEEDTNSASVMPESNYFEEAASWGSAQDNEEK